METYWFVFVTIFLVVLVQIPIAVDLLRFMFPEWRVARLASRAAQSILFAVMGVIFCIGLGYHLFVYLPLISEDPLHSVKGLLHTVFAVWVWINVVVNYYLAVFIHPAGGGGGDKMADSDSQKDGQRPVREGEQSAEMERERDCITEGRGLRSRLTNDRAASSRQDIITEQDVVKDERAPIRNGVDWRPKRDHRCKICRCKVTYMDHHCPFTGNCVGLHNYSHFYIGLCYGVIGLGYAVAITLPYFYNCNMKNILWFFGLIRDRTPNGVCVQLGPHSHIFLPVFTGFCLSLNILLLQTVFLLSDLSTYNVLKNWSRYPMFHFAWQRIRAGKCLEPSSRLSVCITSQRRNILWYLFPVRNSGRKSLEQS